MTKTLIVFDANILFINEGRGHSYDSFELNRNYYEIDDFVKINKLSKKIDCIIPKIVLEELLQIKKEKYLADIDKLNERAQYFKGFNYVKVEFPQDTFNYEKHIDLIKQQTIASLKLKILDYPKNKKLPSIITRSIYRKSPFKRSQEHSDYGFKDAILFESILEYKPIHNYSDVILFTDDKGFDTDCINEFNRITSNTLHITDESKKVMKILSNKYNISEKKYKYRRVALKSVLKDKIIEKANNLGFMVRNMSYSIDVVFVRELIQDVEFDEYSNDEVAIIKSNIILKNNSHNKSKKSTVYTKIDDAGNILEIDFKPVLVLV